jgi:hypothetical protein
MEQPSIEGVWERSAQKNNWTSTLPQEMKQQDDD